MIEFSDANAFIDELAINMNEGFLDKKFLNLVRSAREQTIGGKTIPFEEFVDMILRDESMKALYYGAIGRKENVEDSAQS